MQPTPPESPSTAPPLPPSNFVRRDAGPTPARPQPCCPITPAPPPVAPPHTLCRHAPLPAYPSLRPSPLPTLHATMPPALLLSSLSLRRRHPPTVRAHVVRLLVDGGHGGGGGVLAPTPAAQQRVKAASQASSRRRGIRTTCFWRHPQWNSINPACSKNPPRQGKGIQIEMNLLLEICFAQKSLPSLMGVKGISASCHSRAFPMELFSIDFIVI